MPDVNANGATSPAGDRHPGEILNVELVGGREWTRRAEDVPQGIAWVEVDGVWQPVVRVEVVEGERRREITRFGPDGMFLDTTMQIASPSPASPDQDEPVPLRADDSP